VLAVAVFGIVMVSTFTAHLNHSLTGIPLTPEARQEIQSKETQLAGMELPKNLTAEMAATVRNTVSEAFLSGFRVVLFACAGLSIASAAVAWRFVPTKDRSSSIKIKQG
jgi:hypothetical protein